MKKKEILLTMVMKKFGDKENEEFWIKLGYNPSYYNFYNDGLRWSTYCEFN